jgi:hypothetical protein
VSHYRKVDVRIWNDEKFMELSDDGKLTFMLLMTHPHQTMLGAMRATIGSLADDLGWTSERLSKAFRETCDKGMARHQQSTRLVWLPNFLKYNRPESPNVVKAWPAAYELLPECSMKSDIWRASEGFVKSMSKPFIEAFESLPKDYAESGAGAGTGTGVIQEPPYPPSQGGAETNLSVSVNDAKAIEPRDAPPQADMPIKPRLGKRTAPEILEHYAEPTKRQVESVAPEPVPAGVDIESGLRIWDGMSKAAKAVVSPQPFELWIRPIKAKGVLDGILYLQIPSEEFSHVPARYDFTQYLPADVREIRILNAMGATA